MRRGAWIGLIALIVVAGGTLATSRGRNIIWAAYTRVRGRYSVEERLAQYGKGARARLLPHFERAGVEYPPGQVGLLVLKRERRMQLFAGPDESGLRFITEYAIQGQSGDLGPKLREGDRQVPEGRYEIESLNPNSRFHLALRLNYPNDFDRARGMEDGRTSLGSDIMIHGGTASIGCLAMGDEVSENLFVLVAETGPLQTRVVIAPVDFREEPGWVPRDGGPAWSSRLYSRLRNDLVAYSR